MARSTRGSAPDGLRRAPIAGDGAPRALMACVALCARRSRARVLSRSERRLWSGVTLSSGRHSVLVGNGRGRLREISAALCRFSCWRGRLNPKGTRTPSVVPPSPRPKTAPRPNRTPGSASLVESLVGHMVQLCTARGAGPAALRLSGPVVRVRLSPADVACAAGRSLSNAFDRPARCDPASGLGPSAPIHPTSFFHAAKRERPSK